jgi:Fe2+ or Zn2+ uptake regulation protein
VVELGDCDVGPRLAELGASHGFQVTGHSVEAFGLCADCTRN